MKRLIITTGDVDGIGLEVAQKSLTSLGPQRGFQFIIVRGPSEAPTLRIPGFQITTTSCLDDALDYLAHCPRSSALVEVISEATPAAWVEEAALCAIKGRVSGIITGPLSKTAIQKAGFSDVGHTQILKRVSKSKAASMLFVGEHFNVLLATDHIALKDVAETLSPGLIKQKVNEALLARKLLPPKQRHKPIGVLGLDPHCGDSGVIGAFDGQLKKCLSKNFAAASVVGPLVPDSAFLKENWNRYSIYLALYHDQGLIPFKMIHGYTSGVHITVGLPLLRTSVDHGTAKEIFGKNRANSGSMICAIQWAVRLSKGM